MFTIVGVAIGWVGIAVAALVAAPAGAVAQARGASGPLASYEGIVFLLNGVFAGTSTPVQQLDMPGAVGFARKVMLEPRR